MHNSLAITKKSVGMNIGNVSFYIKYLTLDLKRRERDSRLKYFTCLRKHQPFSLQRYSLIQRHVQCCHQRWDGLYTATIPSARYVTSSHNMWLKHSQRIHSRTDSTSSG